MSETHRTSKQKLGETHNIKERVRVIRARRDLTQPEFAALMRFSRNTVSAVENGAKPSKRFLEQLEALEELEGLEPANSQFDGRAKRPDLGVRIENRSKNPIATAEIVSVGKIPMLSWAQAGEATDYEELPLDWQKTVPKVLADPKAFAVQVAGDSMEPRYQAGDVAYLSPSSPVHQNETVIARLEGQGVVFKIYNRKNDIVSFSSYNPAYKPFDVPVEEISWVYPVHYVMKILKK